MNSENAIETTGDSVEEAIGKGLAALNARPMEVIIEVLEEPVQGVFGLESRPARVRVQRIAPPAPPTPPSTEARPVEPPSDIVRLPEPPPRPPQAERSRERSASSDRRGRDDRGRERAETPERERSDRPPRPAFERPAFKKPEGQDDTPAYMDVSEDDDALPFADTADEVPQADQDEEVAVSKVVLNELLERMDMRCKIVVRRAQPDNQTASAPWILDIYGANATHLIGRRGETLAALQYLTRLIASRELQRRSDVIIDVESYKSRRAKTLYTLAVRMAEEAMSRNRIVALEPMPPHERRIIHLALRQHPDVETRSVGEGQGRKVTIVPKGLA
jgi:spoIIIJ-associated protein